jgi:hypothetical protein
VEKPVAYQAQVLPIMIASPGDMLDARRVVRDVIHEWNYVHSLPTNLVLMPVGWETHASPDLSGRPQEIINERVLKDCDLLVGLFWTKLGTPTGKAASGSVEEIERHLAAGKPAMIYFSSEPVAPASLDATQHAALQDFKRWCQSKGLIEEFENLPDLAAKFTRQLQLTLRDNPYLRAQAQRDTDGDTFFPPQVTVSEPGSSLSDEAKEVLMEAATDKSGQVLKEQYIGGSHIQTNGKTFGRGADPRAWARWEFALEQLVNEGLLRLAGSLGEGLLRVAGQSGEIFRVTKEGFELADRLRTAEH